MLTKQSATHIVSKMWATWNNLVIMDKNTFILGHDDWQFGFHMCFLPWTECRQYDSPKRLYLFFGPLGGLTVGEKTQSWSLFKGYTHNWRRMVYNPPDWLSKHYSPLEWPDPKKG